MVIVNGAKARRRPGRSAHLVGSLNSLKGNCCYGGGLRGVADAVDQGAAEALPGYGHLIVRLKTNTLGITRGGGAQEVHVHVSWMVMAGVAEQVVFDHL